MPHGEHSDLVVELDEPFDDDASCSGTAAGLGYREAGATFSPFLTTLWPLREELITGFATHGVPTPAMAAR